MSTDTGLDKQWGAQRDCGGNSATPASAIEKHNRGKGETVLDLSRPHKAADVPDRIVKSHRDEGAGNETPKSHEPGARGSKKVPASRRFKS